MIKESSKLSTKLRHVDIYNYWLRQEHQAGRAQFRWIPTAEMPADGLTKALSRQKHEAFVRLVGLRDITEQLEQLETEQRMEALGDKIKGARLAAEGTYEVYFACKGSDLRG